MRIVEIEGRGDDAATIMDPAITDNIDCLEQGMRLLEKLPPHLYTAKCQAVPGASVGHHLRHNIDHYTNFLAQVRSGTIEYDTRDRNPSIETDPEVAREHLGSITQGLRALSNEDLDLPLQVMVKSGTGEFSSLSSRRRELQFLLSHTIHHYAIMAVLCRLHQVEPDHDFGVAPSTLEFRQRAKALL